MKQTNNAIKFLMAQYRAIFKHAYLKGLVSAVVLTAGLSNITAQAANAPAYSSSDEWYQDTTGSGGWSTQQTTPLQQVTTNKIAGAVADTTNSNYDVSGGRLSLVDSDGNIQANVKATVMGGNAERDTVGDVNVHNNTVIMKESVFVSGASIYGGFALAQKGTATASENEVYIQDRNKVNIGGSGSNSQQNAIAGGKATAFNGATASGNNLFVTGKSGTEISLSTRGQIVGGIAADWKTSGTGTFVAQNNKAELTYVTYSGNSSYPGYIAGGSANAVENASSGDLTLSALGNELIINSGTFVNSGTNLGLEIVGNRALGSKDTGNSGSGSINVEAIGDENKFAVYITNSKIDGSSATSGDLFVQGGRAFVNGSGTATANYNRVFISNSNISGSSTGSPLVGVIGGYAYTTNGSAFGSNNSVTIENTNFSYTNIVGAELTASGSGADMTANNNSVTLTGSNTDDSPYTFENGQIGNTFLTLHSGTTSSDGNIFVANGNTISVTGGQNLKVTDSSVKAVEIAFSGSGVTTSGASVTANDNSIVFDAILVGDGNTSGANQPNVIRAVNIDIKTGKANKPATATGNSVTIGENAVVTNADIYAVSSGKIDTLATNNNVTINGDVTNAIVTGGQGKDSAITINGSYTIDNTRKNDNKAVGYSLRSDIININGDFTVDTGANVQLSGYFTDGDYINDSKNFNSNLTTVSSEATIANAGEIHVWGKMVVEDGATLSAQSDGALLVANASDNNHVQWNIANNVYRDKNDIREDYGVIEMSKASLDNYLKSNEETINGVTKQDSAGAIQLTEGGKLFITDNSWTVSNEQFVTSSASAGHILIESDLTSGGSVLAADTIVVEHQLVKDNSLSGDALLDSSNAVAADGVIFEADHLVLGSNKIDQDQAKAIDFGYADVAKSVTFNAVKYKDPNTGTYNGHSTAFNLAGNINLDAKTEHVIVNDKVLEPLATGVNVFGEKHFFTPESGELNGDVVLTTSGTDTGTLHAENGNWTANGAITMESGSMIIVGKDTTTTPTIYDDVGLDTDATLVLSKGLTIKSTAATDTVSIVVRGEGLEYDFDDAAHAKDEVELYDRLAQLDLRAGITLTGDNKVLKGRSTIDAESGGVVLLNGANLSAILAQNDKTTAPANQKGILFAGSTGGKFIAEGNVSADFDDFVNDTGSTLVGMDLHNGGILEADSLTLTHDETPSTSTSLEKDSDYIKTAQTIDIGGTVRVNDLIITDNTRTTTTVNNVTNTGITSQATVASGTLVVANSISSANSKLILGDGAKSVTLRLNSNTVDHASSVDVANLVLNKNSDINVNNGQWTGENTTLTLSEQAKLFVGGTANYDKELNPSFTAKSLVAQKNAIVGIDTDGSATFTTADLSGLAKYNYTGTPYFNITTGLQSGLLVRGDLTIVGDSALTEANNGVTFGTEGSIYVANGGHLTFGQAATIGAIIDDNVTASANAVTLKPKYTKITVNGGEVELGLTNSVFSKDALIDLKNKLFTSDSFGETNILANGGTLNIGDATFEGLDLTSNGSGGYYIEWNDYKVFSDVFSNNMDVTNNQLKKTNVKNVTTDALFRGNVGSATLAQGHSYLNIVGDTSFNYADGNNGLYVSTADGKAASAEVAQSRTLRLVDGGRIENVTLAEGLGDQVDDDLTILQIEGSGETTIANIYGKNNLTGYDWNNTQVNVKAQTHVTGDINGIAMVHTDASTLTVDGDITSNELAVTNGGAVTTKTATLESLTAVGGTVDVTDTLTIMDPEEESLFILNGSTVTADKLNVINANPSLSDTILRIGLDANEIANYPELANMVGTGYLQVGELSLDSTSIFADPSYDESTSLVAIGKFNTPNPSINNDTTTDLGVQDGDIIVGKNAAVGIGTDLDGLRKAISGFQNGGALNADKYGSILYLNGQLEIDAGENIALNSSNTAQSFNDVRSSLTYTDASNVIHHYGADMGLGANTAIVLSDKVFLDENGNKTEVAFHFKKTGAIVNSNGGEIVLQGSFSTADKLNFFTDEDAALGESGCGIKLTGQDIKVLTENGFLFTTIEVGDDVGYNLTLKVDEEHAYNIMSEASNPVVQSMIAYGNRGVATTTSTTTTTTTEQTVDETTSSDTTSTNSSAIESSQFLDKVITTTHGAPAETAARLAVYGGAAQAALKAGSSSYETILGHMGVGGNDSIITTASNGQGAGLWVTPIYNNAESDSLDAQGLDYGVDMDLYGLALGGDFTMSNGIRFGAMFNVGSGDADGQGNTAAASVSNDFDYYGFGVYVGYSYDQFSVIGDITYTSVDNEVTAQSELGEISSTLDSSNLSIGVTGQYTFNLDAIDVVPHVGLRFTQIDMDDYTVKNQGVDVAHFSADSMSVFSIPVGVTFSKDIVAGEWTVKPSFDLTLTANVGDDEIDGTVTWVDANNLKTNLTSEVVDTFTYGATAGLSAKTGNFSLGVDVNYTGASNTDELGVKANARFMF